MRKLLAAVVVASLFAVIGPAGEAEGCSCAVSDPATQLEEASAAFVGTLVERPDQTEAPDGPAVWVFEVEEWVKGDLGPEVGVHSGLGGGDCGFEMAVGDSAGVLLYNDNGRPSSGLCSVTTPEGLRTANKPLVIDGSGPAVFLVAGDTGRARLATLDAAGRLLAVAGTDGFGWSVSLCPGGELVVDVVEGEVTTRDTTTLEVVESPAPEGGRTEAVWCLTDDGSVILGQSWDESGVRQQLQLLGSDQVLFEGEIMQMAASSRVLAVVAAPASHLVDLISVETGESSTLDTGGGEVGRIAFSPDGTRLLVAKTEYPPAGGYTTAAVVHDVGSGEVVWSRPGMADTDVVGWIDDTTLTASIRPVEAIAPQGMVIDIATDTVKDIALGGWEVFAVGDSLVAVEEGRLVMTRPGGEAEIVAALPSPGHRLIGVLDRDATLTPAGPVPTTNGAPVATVAAAPETPTLSLLTILVPAMAGLVVLIGAGWVVIRRRR